MSVILFWSYLRDLQKVLFYLHITIEMMSNSIVSFYYLNFEVFFVIDCNDGGLKRFYWPRKVFFTWTSKMMGNSNVLIWRKSIFSERSIWWGLLWLLRGSNVCRCPRRPHRWSRCCRREGCEGPAQPETQV